MVMIGIGYWVDFGTVKEPLNYRAAANILNEMIEKDPGNVDLYINLAIRGIEPSSPACGYKK